MNKEQMIEQQELKGLLESNAELVVLVVKSPIVGKESEYALKIKALDREQYLMRQKVKRIRGFKTVDAAWKLAKRLGVKNLNLIDDGNK